MANTKKFDYVILGFLVHEPMTGYEIKKRIDSTLHFFWSGSFGSIYPTLNTLTEKGLITKSDISENKREKLSYSITEDGRHYLKKWLTVPVEKDELHYETLLKLFFGKELGREETLKHIQRFEEKVRIELEILQMCVNNLEQVQEEEDHIYYLLTAMFGVETYQGYLKWCEEAKTILKGEQT